MADVERINDANPECDIDESHEAALLNLRACIQIIKSKCFPTTERIDGFEWKLLLADIEGTIEDCINKKYKNTRMMGKTKKKSRKKKRRREERSMLDSVEH